MSGDTTPYGMAVAELREAIGTVRVRGNQISEEDKALLIGKMRSVTNTWKAFVESAQQQIPRQRRAS